MSFRDSVKGEMETLVLDERNFAIRGPFRMNLCGPTMAGKSKFCLNLIQHHKKMFSPPVEEILFCAPYDVENPTSDRQREFVTAIKLYFPTIQFHVGLPSVSTMINFCETCPGHKLLIADDLMKEVNDDEGFVDLMTKFSHHQSLSVIWSSQCYFTRGRNKSKFGNTAILQVSEKVLFNDRSDISWMNLVSSKSFGLGRSNVLRNAMNIVCDIFPANMANEGDRSGQYLVIDCSQISINDDRMKLKTNIFPNENNEFEQIFFH